MKKFNKKLLLLMGTFLVTVLVVMKAVITGLLEKIILPTMLKIIFLHKEKKMERIGSH